MKPLQALIILTLITKFVSAQYYYQDIISSIQVTDKWKMYKSNKVKSVNILSFESDNTPTKGFVCNQNASDDYSQVITYTKTDFTRETYLISYYTLTGMLQKTVDTSKGYQSTTEYIIDASDKITAIKNSSVETENNIRNAEDHLWQYGNDGMPTAMIKIKNSNDTTFIHFVKDEKGNIVEEHATHNRTELPVIFYYYDDNKKLTDIVRYNEKAQRLLPDYMFTYNNRGQLISMLYVPEGSNDYDKWIYTYNDAGLRISETCYDKQKQMLGKIEYEYSFR